MGVNLWGASPLYETGSLKEDHHAKWITLIDKVRGEGNCGEATNRGKEAGAKTCEATYRNVIQGRVAEASGPSITKPFPARQQGKWRACAGTVHVLIWGGLIDVPGSSA